MCGDPAPSAPGLGSLQVNGIKLASCSLSCLFGLVFPRIRARVVPSQLCPNKQNWIKTPPAAPRGSGSVPGQEEEVGALSGPPLYFSLTNPRLCIFKVL